MTTPHRRRRMTVAVAVALAGTGLPALPALADPIVPQGDAVTVIIPVSEDAITVTVSRRPADAPASTTPLVTPRPPAPRPDAPPPAPAPGPAASTTATAAPAPTPPPATATTAAAPTVDAVTITPTTPATVPVPASPPVASGSTEQTSPATSLPTPAGTQAPSQHTTPTIPAPAPTSTDLRSTTATAAPAPAASPEGTGPAAPDTTATATATGVPTTSTPGAAPQAQRSAPSPQAAAAVQASEGRASGMPWRSGVFAHSLDRVGRYEAKTGRPVDVLAVAPSRGSWSTIMDTWWMARPAGFTGTLDVAVPLWQEDGDLATAAAGGYNAQWTELGRLIESEYPGSTVRPGWEFNLGGWAHHATLENVEKWKQAFRHASTSLKAGGPSLLVTWNPNKGRGDSLPNAADAWPGDDVVDIVAIDAYDWWPAYDESTWPEHRDGDQGWRYWVDFARQHAKKFGVPEWGVAPGNEQGGGDNPYFIQVVTDFLAQEHAKDGIVHHTLYFDEPMSYIANSIGDGQVPAAGQALNEAMTKISSSASSADGGGAPQAATGPESSPTRPPTAEPSTSPPSSAPDQTASATAASTEPAQSPTPGASPSRVPVDLAPPSAAPSSTAEGEWDSPDSGPHGPTPRG